MNQLGSNILQATRILQAFGEEIETFRNELESVLQKHSDAVIARFDEEIADAKDDTYNSGNDWVLDGWHWSFPATEAKQGPGKKRRLGTLSVLADIGGLKRPAIALGMPCLVVGWAPRYESWAEDYKDFWPRIAQESEVRSGRLLWWHGVDSDAQEWRDKQPRDAWWIYMLPLVAVSNSDKLKKLIVEPVANLLDGSDVGAAFANATEVLRFRQESNRIVLDETVSS